MSQILDEIRELLGPTYDAITAVDQKERKHKPIRSRHRLAVLLHALRAHGDGLHSFPISLLVAVSELSTVRTLLANARSHPAWNTFVRGLKSPSEYAHTVVQLSLMHMLASTNFEALVHPESKAGRMCDLRLRAPSGDYINVEIKAPESLLWPNEPFTPAEAREQVKKAFRKAGTTDKGQLPPSAPGLLVIGGFSLTSRTHALCEAAARNLFENPPSDYSHIVGVVFSWVGTVMSDDDAEVMGNRFRMDTLITTVTQNELVENPFYPGPLFLEMV